jgi:hypothetical protein
MRGFAHLRTCGPSAEKNVSGGLKDKLASGALGHPTGSQNVEDGSAEVLQVTMEVVEDQPW